MSASARDLKISLRRQLRAEMARHPAAERVALSARLCDLLRQQAQWQQARAVLFFVPRLDEPDVLPLLAEFLGRGGLAVLPAFSESSSTYELRAVGDTSADLVPGRHGIPQPGPWCASVAANRLDLVLVPGVGFDLAGRRLGRGQGVFDRLLADVSAWKCGVAFDWQVVAELPVEPHDVLLNSILTPSRWHGVAGHGRS
ncbi:MAG TPA: 5-formyltetrahydrofolate cyclo-ligase [Methylomirabilota bacterium]|nr:5-formyltetrahydrofolate cyclo-ligase [Methylomirabilota bacterium]